MNPPTGILIHGSNNNINAASINVTEVLMRLHGLGGQDAIEAAGILKARHELAVDKWAMNELLGLTSGDRPKSTWEQLMAHISQFNAEPGVCHAMVALFINRVVRNEGSIEDGWPSESETRTLTEKLQRVQKEYQLQAMKLKVSSPDIARTDLLKKATNRTFKSPELAREGIKFELRYRVLMENAAVNGAAMRWDEIFRRVREFRLCLLTIQIGHQAHSVALAGQNGKWYLLDPNYGLYRYATSSQMRDDLKRLLTEYKATGFSLFAPNVTG